MGSCGCRLGRTLASAILTLVVTLAPLSSRADSAPSFAHARIASRSGHAVFEVDGAPFFLYGAAFFYERLPRDRWRDSLGRLAGMGINTLDLYVPWNWHEIADGDFDFDGRTNPRRDFDEVLRLAKAFDFKIVIRPGPVVRNEWRNGGYPAWLLTRPEYGMPLHDLLEGRYPPTATLQNQHSDDAAAQWMRNATHVVYAKRWIEHVLRETAPYADRILAVALDDDQAAYIDNQTYPAPHLQAYLEWLRDVVHGVTGPAELTFINTYQMKVPAASPVWAMGNWYQSDAYAIGTHDEAQLAFSMAQLATRPNQPLFASEFQAGWLQGAGEAYPRAADPSNTELAIATMIGTGVRGLVNFPAQDTLDPTGWEAPFANFAYAWDAALRLDGSRAARYLPTARFGAFVRTFGRALAASFPRYDASIVYPGSSVPSAASGGTTFATIANATIAAQQACRSARFACNLVDVGAISAATLARGSVLLVPAFDSETRRALGSRLRTQLAALGRRGIIVRSVATESDVRTALGTRRAIVENVSDAVFSESPGSSPAGFLSVTNYSSQSASYASAVVGTSEGKRLSLEPFVVPAHGAIVAPIVLRPATATSNPNVRRAYLAIDPRAADSSATAGETARAEVSLRPGLILPAHVESNASNAASNGLLPRVAPTDIFREGADSIDFENARTRLLLSPQAGARSFVFGEAASTVNWFTTVGGLRDDVALEPPLSTTDRIAKYTHDFPAGTFNRPYAVSALGTDTATFSYTMPDALPSGATFVRTLRLAPPREAGFDLSDSVAFADLAALPQQRGVSVSSFARDANDSGATQAQLYAPLRVAIVAGTTVVVPGNAFAVVRGDACLVVAWHAGDLERAEVYERADSLVARLTLAPERTAHFVYRFVALREEAVPDALARIAAEAQRRAQVAPSPARTP